MASRDSVVTEAGALSLAVDAITPAAAYKLMVSAIVPRPIAWVSTVGADGTPNLAPFSFYNGVAGPPPIVMFSPELRDGQPKDTLRNVRETGEFVLNVVDEALAAQMCHTAGDWPYAASEYDLEGLAMASSVDVRPPRVADAPVAMEARVTQIVPVIGTEYTMVLGRIVRFHIRAGLLQENGSLDVRLLRPVARLGGAEYATIGEVFRMRAPEIPSAPPDGGQGRR